MEGINGGSIPLLTTRQLHESAIMGDVPSLLNLFRVDPFILDRCMVENLGFMQSSLHIAASLGHLEFTKEILSRKPELAEGLDLMKKRSPLHMASTKGYMQIVEALLVVNPNMCFTRDQDGRNPVHLAAIYGQLYVLDMLLQAKPQAAMERTNDGDTVLHLCVKYSQPQALMFLANVTDDGELLNSKDGNGNTVLHLAVSAKQLEIVKFLLKNRRMEKNGVNKNGSTAMDVLMRSKKNANDREMKKSLKQARELRAKKASALQPRDAYTSDRLENHRSALMIVASLIATIAFQAGTNPPGGAWQDNKDGHMAGQSIMANVSKYQYKQLEFCTTVGLMSSLTVILLLISGLPYKRLFVSVLIITMWIAVTATAYTFTYFLEFLSPFNEINWLVIYIPVGGWLLLMLFLLLRLFTSFTVKLINKVVRLGKKVVQDCKRCFQAMQTISTVSSRTLT